MWTMSGELSNKGVVDNPTSRYTTGMIQLEAWPNQIIVIHAFHLLTREPLTGFIPLEIYLQSKKKIGDKKALFGNF